jgi:hypothetical protein
VSYLVKSRGDLVSGIGFGDMFHSEKIEECEKNHEICSDNHDIYIFL